MKSILISISLLFAIGCQTVTPEEQEAKALPPTLVVSGSQYQYIASSELPSDAAKGKAFLAMQAAVSALQWDNVRALALQHLNTYPGNNDAFLFLSIAHAGLGESSRARFYAELVLKSEPSNAFALNILGVIKRKDAQLPEDYRRALVYFQLARQAAPASPTPVLNAASLNLELGNFTEARTDFKQAEEKCFNCVNAMVGSALAIQALGYFDEAKQKIASILATDPGNETARLLQASQLYYVDKEQERGQAVLSELLASGRAGSEVQKEARSMMNRIESVAH